MGLVRVTVASATHRVDLAVPGSLPVAELLPELARTLGVLEATTAHDGFHLHRADGRPLAGNIGLTSQGVVDGGLLLLEPAVVGPAPPHDDVVEAMADAVEQVFVPVPSAVLRLVGLAAGALLFVFGAVSLAMQGGRSAGAVATLLCALLGAGAVVVARREQAAAGLALAWAATAYGAVAGRELATGSASSGSGLVAAGAGAALVASALLAGLRRHRALFIPAVIVSGASVAAGLVVAVAGLDAQGVMTTVAIVALLATPFLPRLALAVAEATAGGAHRRSDINDSAAVDQDSVRAAAAVAHQIVLAVTAAVGLMIVVVAPMAAWDGISGALLALAASSVLMLSTRHSRSGAEVMGGVGFGLVAIALSAGAVLWQHPLWAAWASVVLVATGVVVLAFTLAPTASLRRARCAEVAEAIALIALLPLLVLTVAANGLVR